MYTHYLNRTAADPIGLCGEFCELCSDEVETINCPKCLEIIAQYKKFIHFPGNGKIEIIYTNGKTWTFEKKVDLEGSARIKDLLEGRFQFYSARRCHPYSQELWDACMRWVEKRDALKKEYEQLMIKGLPHDQ